MLQCYSWSFCHEPFNLLHVSALCRHLCGASAFHQIMFSANDAKMVKVRGCRESGEVGVTPCSFLLHPAFAPHRFCCSNASNNCCVL